MTMEWTNWAGTERVAAPVAQPGTLDALRERVAGARGALRVVGAGHSFTPLLNGAAEIIQLDALPSHAPEIIGENLVRVDASRRLHEHSRALTDAGLAFRNLGDINVQSLAGAMATATHGTGAALPCISAELRGARVLLADGSLREFAADDPDLPGVQVSMGLLGILLDAEVSVVPRYRLRRQVRVARLEDTLAQMETLWEENRHFEFFFLPASGRTIEVRHNISEAPEGKAPVDLDMLAVRAMRGLRALGRLSPQARRWGMAALLAFQGEEDYIGESWQVLSKPRGIRFKEMEYHIPEAAAGDMLRELFQRLERDHPNEYFPIEVRKTAGDDAWLSPFQGGARVSVALHTDAGDPHEGYFAAMEPLLRAAGGRPHWGKMHSLTAPDLEALYPDLERFRALRAQLDPDGRFLTPQMRQVIGA